MWLHSRVAAMCRVGGILGSSAAECRAVWEPCPLLNRFPQSSHGWRVLGARQPGGRKSRLIAVPFRVRTLTCSYTFKMSAGDTLGPGGLCSRWLQPSGRPGCRRAMSTVIKTPPPSSCSGSWTSAVWVTSHPVCAFSGCRSTPVAHQLANIRPSSPRPSPLAEARPAGLLPFPYRKSAMRCCRLRGVRFLALSVCH